MGFTDDLVRGLGAGGLGFEAAVLAYQTARTWIDARGGLGNAEGPIEFVVTSVGPGLVIKGMRGVATKAAGEYLVAGVGGIRATIRTWPRHHPFPKYLGGSINQTLKKIPRKLHQQFHASLDAWKGAKYSRSKGAKYFEGIDKSTVIEDLREFYKTADGGIFERFLADFEQAVLESGH